jgi:hypothetical protein
MSRKIYSKLPKSIISIIGQEFDKTVRIVLQKSEKQGILLIYLKGYTYLGDYVSQSISDSAFFFSYNKQKKNV